MSDTRVYGLNMNTEKTKSLLKKRSVKNANSELNKNEKNIKKEVLIEPEIISKRKTKIVSKYSRGCDKRHNKSAEYNKANNLIKIGSIKIDPTLQESKIKSATSRTSLVSKSIAGNVKFASSLAERSHSKTRSKTNVKSKKVNITKPKTFNTDKMLSYNPPLIRNDNFDLADLIEASLKNIRSPRSIFDYDFSCMQQTATTRTASKTRNEI